MIMASNTTVVENNTPYITYQSSNNGEHHKKIEKLEPLLDSVICLTRILEGTNITRLYRTPRSDAKRYAEFYHVSSGNIERILVDPKANLMDEGETTSNVITKEQFLDWMGKHMASYDDVHNHLLSYIKKVPEMLKTLQVNMREPKGFNQDYI